MNRSHGQSPSWWSERLPCSLFLPPEKKEIMTPQEKFNATRRELSAALIERDEEIDLVLTALVAQQHVLLVGPPGTGKSLLSDAIVEWMDGAKFSILLNKFTTPEETVGPISLIGLKSDEYRRVVDGYLPTAHVAFIDEIWKASSAILNTLLKLLNERVFTNGTEVIRCPLRLCVAASNEWPSSEDGKELTALFDRFLFRRSVRPISTETGRDRLLFDDRIGKPRLSTKSTPEDIDQAHREASVLPWSEDAKDALRSILHEARREGIQPGDRRMRESVKSARAYAWLNGASLRIGPARGRGY